MDAHSFNFVLVDIPQGEYYVEVQAKIVSSTDTSGTGEVAVAQGLIGQGAVTMEEVRFIKTDSAADEPFVLN